jgi:WD40 repeat protein
MTFPAERRSPKADVTRVVAIDLSPDGSCLVSGSTDGEVALWDTASLAKSAVVAKGSAPIHKVRFSPNGKLVAATNDRNELSFLRAEAKAGGFFTRIFGASTNSVGSADGWLDVVFSADGKRAAAAAKESIINILDLNTLKVIKSPRGDKVVALSPKGDLLASANLVRTQAKDYLEGLSL